MKTLGEIEARAKRIYIPSNSYIDGLQRDNRLLIRAVRELGVVYRAMYREDKQVAEFISPDVLALLEEE